MIRIAPEIKRILPWFAGHSFIIFFWNPSIGLLLALSALQFWIHVRIQDPDFDPHPAQNITKSCRPLSYRPIKFHRNPSITCWDIPLKLKNPVLIRLLDPNYDPDRAQKLISSSMSRHLSTRNISSKSTHVFLSNIVTDRQTDRQVFIDSASATI